VFYTARITIITIDHVQEKDIMQVLGKYLIVSWTLTGNQKRHNSKEMSPSI